MANFSFSPSSAVGKRVKAALDLLQTAFEDDGGVLKTRTVVQSLITLACKLAATKRTAGHQEELRDFFVTFINELSRQVELGQNATDSDYLLFQTSVNANVKGAARQRHEVLLRKLFVLAPKLADIFDSSVLSEAGLTRRITELSNNINDLVDLANEKHSASTGEDLF